MIAIPPKIFVVGCPRSGTTLLLDILRMNPQCVHVTREGLGLPLIASPTRETGIFENYRDDQDVGERFAKLEAQHPSKTLVCKTPSHAFHISRIKSLFPTAVVAATLRDPRDNAISMLAARRDFGWDWMPEDYRDALDHWAMYYERLVMADQIFRYEDAINHRKAYVQNVYAALRLPYDCALLDEVVRRTDKGANVSDLREGMYRKGIVGEWREVLTPEQKAEAVEVLGDTLRTLGYDLE